MSQPIRSMRLPRVRRARHGQMLVVALAILFVLLIIGGIFVTMIGRNLTLTARSRDDQSAEQFAEAGIRYCNSQLETSAEGADWRPMPTPPMTIADPDYRWLSQGFTRIAYQGGRALVRLVYDPRVDDPRSSYIQIQSVGRTGELGQAGALDPTLFVQNGNAPRQRRELIAYKQIGLTDYLFFFTNKNHRALDQILGIPAMQNGTGQSGGGPGFNDVSLAIGDPTLIEFPTGVNPVNGGEVIFGAPIYCNGNLRLAGEIHIFESPRGTTGTAAAPTPNVSPESVLVSGSVLLAPNQDVDGNGVITDGDQQVSVNQFGPLTNPLVAGTDKTNLGNVYPSSNANFSTLGALIRDGLTTPDVNGYTRSVPYKDAPVMDGYENGTATLRYRALTRDSGKWGTTPNGITNTGFYGWGTGVYIDNSADLQPETQNGTGGYTLRGDWMNPPPGGTGSSAQQSWLAGFYRPPGVQVELLGDHIRLTRNDGKVFRKPDGTNIASGGNVVDIPLSKTARANYTFSDGTAFALPLLPTDGDDLTTNGGSRVPGSTAAFPADPDSYGVNLVIMAEGNVRVKGVFGLVTSPQSADHLSRVHLTIVSGGTAYIDGNILKGDGYNPTPNNPVTVHMERASTCAILAKDYVCVNTTMFMASANQGLPWTPTGSINGPPYTLDITRDAPYYDPAVAFGVDPATYVTPVYLFLRHASNVEGSNNATAMNLQINPVLDIGGDSYYDFSGANVVYPGLPPVPGFRYTYPLGQRYQSNTFVTDVTQLLPNLEQRTFPLTGLPGPPFIPNYTGLSLFPTLLTGQNVGYDNVFHLMKDTTAAFYGVTGFSETEDYMPSATMVAPLDIRIEALLFAQERSFFVIPGYSFNQDPNDTRINFLKTGTRSLYSQDFEGHTPQTAGTTAKDPFPFYGESMDVRITIFGAITQNYTASAGDQAAWVGQWGYIPTVHGSSGTAIPTSHIQVNDGAKFVLAEDSAQDWRSPKEKADGITRGLRFIYDPALSLPYQHASMQSLSGTGGVTNRQQFAVRSLYVPAIVVSGSVTLPATTLILPSIPRLPVCPGLLYFGPPDSPVVP